VGSKELIKRYGIFLIGLLLMGMGIALVTTAELGTTAISTVPYVLSMIVPLSFGQLTFLLSLIFLGIQLILQGKSFPKIQYCQILIGPLFGLCIDLGMFMFSFMKPSIWVMQIVVLLIGCFILAVGIFMQIQANVIINSGEAAVKVISEKIGKNFGLVKIQFDWTLVVIALLLSLISFQSIKGIGIGTVTSAFLVGYFIKFLFFFTKKFSVE
jgi:uncharacterized membrane protein YczE